MSQHITATLPEGGIPAAGTAEIGLQALIDKAAAPKAELLEGQSLVLEGSTTFTRCPE